MAQSALPPDPSSQPAPGSLASRLQARFEGYDADEGHADDPHGLAIDPSPAGRPVPGGSNPRKVQLQLDDLDHQLDVLRDQLDLAFDEFDQRLEASETRASVAEARASVAEARASVAETRAHDAETLATAAHARIDQLLDVVDDLMPPGPADGSGDADAGPTSLRSALDRLRDRLDVG